MKTSLYVAIVATTFMLKACATTDRGQRTFGEKITDMSSTEAMFEAESLKETELLQRSAARIRDIKLETYVGDIANESAGEYGDEVDVYLLEVPEFNAYMYPNGTMGVYSGLMLRVESEDELALVLGHEFGHYYEKHSLERHAKGKNANHAMNAVSILTAPTGLGGLVVETLASAAFIGEFSAFSRKQETEADVIGLERVSKIGYDEGSAIKLWENIENEKKASSIRKVRNRKSRFYDSHPTSQARLEALKAAANIKGDIPRASLQQRSEYRSHIRPYLMNWLEDEIGLRDAGATFNLLDRLDDLGEDQGVLLYARARVLDRALSNKKLKEDKATQALVAGKSQDDVVALLRLAINHSDVPANAHRELGDSLYKLGQTDEAKAEFERYLVLKPSAEDKSLIESLIAKMEASL